MVSIQVAGTATIVEGIHFKFGRRRLRLSSPGLRDRRVGNVQLFQVTERCERRQSTVGRARSRSATAL